jgi:ribonuclease P protein component
VAVHAPLQGPLGGVKTRSVEFLQLERLKTRSQFQAVLAGQVIAKTAHFALHAIELNPTEVGGIRPQQPDHASPESKTANLFVVRAAPPHGFIGAMVPKRWAKRAVTRNCIKRQIYAISQEFRAAFFNGAHVVRLRSGFAKSQFVSAASSALKTSVRGELLQLFAGVRRKLPPQPLS